MIVRDDRLQGISAPGPDGRGQREALKVPRTNAKTLTVLRETLKVRKTNAKIHDRAGGGVKMLKNRSE